jgi:hypothetical protein
MKKNYMIVSALVLAVGVLSFQRTGNESIDKYLSKQHIRPGGNGLGGYSGAPGDGNCTSCHGGSTQSGTSKNTLTLTSGSILVTTYLPGVTYNVALTMNPNPSKKGFEAVAMYGNNLIAGTTAVVNGGGTSITNNRHHHTGTSNTSSNLAWIWSWTAPSTNVGNITFYVCTMVSDNNGIESGDVVYLSQHVIAPAANAGIETAVGNTQNFSAGYSSDKNAVVMDFSSLVSGKMYFNLVDLSGKSVFTYKMGEAQIGDNHEVIALPEDLKSGIYVVNMFVGNNPMEQKIMIQK